MRWYNALETCITESKTLVLLTIHPPPPPPKIQTILTSHIINTAEYFIDERKFVLIIKKE
jgi:hypothetical protein